MRSPATCDTWRAFGLCVVLCVVTMESLPISFAVSRYRSADVNDENVVYKWRIYWVSGSLGLTWYLAVFISRRIWGG